MKDWQTIVIVGRGYHAHAAGKDEAVVFVDANFTGNCTVTQRGCCNS